MALGSFIGSVIANQYGINTLFITSSIVALVSLIIILGMNETLTHRIAFHPGLLKIKRREIIEPKVIPAGIVMALTIFSFGCILTLIPDFSEHLSVKNKGLFLTYMTVANILMRFVGGKLSDKYGRVAVLRVSTLILTVSIALVGFSMNQAWFFGSAILLGVGIGLSAPALFAWAVDLAPPQHRGKGMATLYIVLEIGVGSGALLSAPIYANDPDRFPLAFGLGALFCFIAFLYLIQHHRE